MNDEKRIYVAIALLFLLVIGSHIILARSAYIYGGKKACYNTDGGSLTKEFVCYNVEEANAEVETQWGWLGNVTI